MDIFISWSGDRSRRLANALRDWLPLILQYVKPWMSEKDIAGGERWGPAIAEKLAVSNFGILCVTRENVAEPWLVFEAGALAKSVADGRVLPLLLDLDVRDITGPLAQFQATKATEDGIREVIRSVEAAASSGIGDDKVGRLFERIWPDLDTAIRKIPPSVDSREPGRGLEQVLEELVTRVRSVEGMVRAIGPASDVQRLRSAHTVRGRREAESALNSYRWPDRGLVGASELRRLSDTCRNSIPRDLLGRPISEEELRAALEEVLAADK